ncbi:MAG: hypothetical protein NTW14_06545 [bacterium]|nr:hypothetical protein [bacterium]
MMNLSCEEFEKEYPAIKATHASAERLAELEQHRASCALCRQYAQDTRRVREALISLPKLQTPPYFLSNLKREINRMEMGLSKPEWNTGLFPRLALLGSGFTTAIVLGFFLFNPASRQISYPTAASVEPSTDNVATIVTPQVEIKKIAKPTTTHEPLQSRFLADNAPADTAIHKLPERPGHDQITIPVNDDLWRVNQVSTTPPSR